MDVITEQTPRKQCLIVTDQLYIVWNDILLGVRTILVVNGRGSFTARLYIPEEHSINKSVFVNYSYYPIS